MQSQYYLRTAGSTVSTEIQCHEVFSYCSSVCKNHFSSKSVEIKDHVGELRCCTSLCVKTILILT